MKPILAADVDSTVWSPGAWVRDAVLEITGETLDLESVTTLTYLFDFYEEKVAVEVFERVFSPERVREREPYPGSAEVLRDLQQQGIRIHFITHNWDPEAMTPHLEPWLKKHFGPDVGLTVTVEDKLGILDHLDAFGMVDDRPDTIARVADAGLWAATVVQPWNRELVTERADVYGFDSWHEVPDLLPPLPNGTNDV